MLLKSTKLLYGVKFCMTFYVSNKWHIAENCREITGTQTIGPKTYHVFDDVRKTLEKIEK
jgi:hypothetical protein